MPAAKVIIGCDTGFFKHFLEGTPRSLDVWHQARSGESRLVISCISLFELRRLGFKGAIPSEKATTLVSNLPTVCTVIWLGQDNQRLIDRAARMAHGNGLAMADALILTSLIHAGAEEVYTTDEDMMRYKSGPKISKL